VVKGDGSKARDLLAAIKPSRRTSHFGGLPTTVGRLSRVSSGEAPEQNSASFRSWFQAKECCNLRNVTTLLFILAITTRGQPAPPAAFDVASVKASQPGETSIEPGPSSLTMRHVRMNVCIAWAFNIQEPQISGLNWLNDVTFDIFAKSAAPAAEGELRDMLKTLLADRFKMTFHRETKEIPALTLVVSSKGHKLEPAEKPGNPSFRTGKMSLTGTGATLGQLTLFLSQALREPVIDQTGLKGLFNYTLDINAYVTDEIRNSGGDSTPLEANSIIAQAMQAQLGLKVEAKKTAVSILVVDHLEKSPAEN
jgi:uncharacterized protein (TIGR03435 family)